MTARLKWLSGQEGDDGLTRPRSLRRKTFEEWRILWRASARVSVPDPPDSSQEWKKIRNAIAAGEVQSSDEHPRIVWNWDSLLPRLAVGVVLVAIALGGSVYVLTRMSLSEFRTGRGQQTTVFLPDSSEVMLNHNSELTFRQGLFGNARYGSLSGEAYFRVRHTGAPFTIETAAGTVRVVGTEFNVRARDERVEVAVSQGSVEVSSRVSGKDSSIVLTRGEITVCPIGGFPERPHPIRFAQYPGWIHGKLLFYQTPIPTVCKELENLYGVTIRLDGEHVRTLTITGVLEGSTIDQLLTTMCAITQHQYRREDSTYVIY
jgi:transmembrane sensor